MKTKTLIDITLFVTLVAAGAGLRISLEHIPNFAPVAALALFAGYFFRSKLVAVAVPLSIMIVSDRVIGGYAWYQMVAVYTMLCLPVLMAGPLRRWFRLDKVGLGKTATALAGLFGCSLLGSVMFYLVTNAFCLGWYEPTLAGVMNCYVQGLPFFKYTLAGDAFFAAATFTTYATAVQLARRASTANDGVAAPAEFAAD